jgi:hypothetical protein
MHATWRAGHAQAEVIAEVETAVGDSLMEQRRRATGEHGHDDRDELDMAREREIHCGRGRQQEHGGLPSDPVVSPAASTPEIHIAYGYSGTDQTAYMDTLK